MTFHPLSADRRYTIDFEGGFYVLRLSGAVIGRYPRLGQAATRAKGHQGEQLTIVEISSCIPRRLRYVRAVNKEKRNMKNALIISGLIVAAAYLTIIPFLEAVL